MLFRFGDGSLSFHEDDYLRLLRRFREEACRIQSIQLYTLARKPKDEALKALSLQELHAIAKRVREETSFSIAVFD